MEKKAQTALEYLLILGAVILIAAVVVAIIGSLTHQTGHAANNSLCTWLENIAGGCT